MTKPSIGILFHPQFPPEKLISFSQQAEAMGFDELWLWEDSFLGGAFTSAALVLAETQRIKVGIGVIPVTVRNPLFVAMEIATLERLYPGRFLPGFGHGSPVWMKQIGAFAKSSIKALEETVTTVRALLQGETVTMNGEYVHFDNMKMGVIPETLPPLYLGAMREKTLRLSGCISNGTVLPDMSSPAYIRFARQQIEQGMAEGGRSKHRLTVYVQSLVSLDSTERQRVRYGLAERFNWGNVSLEPMGIAAEAMRLYQSYGVEGAAEQMPEEWLDELSISGTPAQAAASFRRLAEAGADSIVLQPLDNDPNCLENYARLLPLLL